MKKLIFLFFCLFACVVTIIAQDGMYEVKNEVFDKDYFRVQPDFYAVNADGVPIWYKVNFRAYEYVSYRKEYDEVVYKPFYNVNPANAEFEKTDEVIVMYDYESIHRNNKNYSGYKKIVVPSEVEYNGKIYRVTKIGDNAFRGSDVEEIILPNSINSIFMGAFSYCSKLKKVELPRVLKVLDRQLFNDCSSLEYITLPSLIRNRCRGNLFDGCTSLKEVSIDKTWNLWNMQSIADIYLVDKYKTGAPLSYEQIINGLWFKLTIRE